MRIPTSGGQALRLEPESGVEIIDGRTHAVSLPIWLRLEPAQIIADSRWIKLRYASSFFDEPVRPLIRFVTTAGATYIQPMNGAVLGSAEWIGRVPDETVSVSISPARRLGRFSFRIERVDAVSRLRLLRRAWLNDPGWTLWAYRSRLINSRQEAWQALKYAVGGTPFDDYSEWHARFSRPLDLEGLDRPRSDWSSAPPIRLLMALDGGDVRSLQTTLSSVQAQAYQGWSLHAAVGDRTSADVLAAFRDAMNRDGRLLELAKAGADPGFADSDRLSVIGIGDILQSYALAAVTEQLTDQPQLSVLYSDEDAVGPSDRLHSPLLKPDWSPAFHQSVRYLGRLTCVRCADIGSRRATIRDFLAEEQAVLGEVLARVGRNAVGHIRRVLYRRGSNNIPEISTSRPISRPRTVEPRWPQVTIVIPTRDRADLLETCTRGLRDLTAYPSFNVVVVDNGSTEADAVALLAALRADSRFTILERPGPFNYSKLSNEGARCTSTSVLVFMNNDVEMLGAGWLKAMVQWAIKPDIGAVGAKLLFPDGKIQHAGVVLGMGGIAGHVYRRCRPDEPGYLHQIEVARETTAVTAACIAMERTKFETVGGFDAENLPVDLNDMDLCLRLAERGWTNIWIPDAVLTHRQSASRGIDRDPFDQYRQERSYFVTRWAETIRDDPYFHPALTLFSQEPSLG